MTSLHEYQNLVGELLNRADEIQTSFRQIDKTINDKGRRAGKAINDRIRRIDNAINDKSAVTKEHADTETVVTNHWKSCCAAIHDSGGEGAERLAFGSTPPPTDASNQTVSDQDLMNQRAAVNAAAASFREAELQLQRHQTRWQRWLHQALRVVGVLVGCYLAYIALQIVVALAVLIVPLAIIAIICIAVYRWLN